MDIGILSRHLGLTPYQSQVLQENYKKYDLSRLVKRGDVLYVPHRANFARRILNPKTDLIGPDKIVQNDVPF